MNVTIPLSSCLKQDKHDPTRFKCLLCGEVGKLSDIMAFGWRRLHTEKLVHASCCPIGVLITNAGREKSVDERIGELEQSLAAALSAELSASQLRDRREPEALEILQSSAIKALQARCSILEESINAIKTDLRGLFEAQVKDRKRMTLIELCQNRTASDTISQSDAVLLECDRIENVLNILRDRHEPPNIDAMLFQCARIEHALNILRGLKI